MSALWLYENMERGSADPLVISHKFLLTEHIYDGESGERRGG